MDEVSRPMVAQRRPKKATQAFHAIPYHSIFVQEDSWLLWHRLDTIYSIFEGYKCHYNRASWAECCCTFERMGYVGALGHPESRVISIKGLIDREGIHCLEDFRSFMLRTLPKDKDGAILLPQVNMRHPTVKKEEDSSSLDHQDTKSTGLETTQQTQVSQEVEGRELSSQMKSLLQKFASLEAKNTKLNVLFL